MLIQIILLVVSVVVCFFVVMSAGAASEKVERTHKGCGMPVLIILIIAMNVIVFLLGEL